MYHFRFQSVLRYRRQIEDQAQRELAALQKRLMTEYSKLEMVEQSLRDHVEETQRRKRQGLTMRELALFDSFFEKFQWESDFQRKNLYLLNQEVEAKRQVFLDASKKKKILEKLKEHEHEKYLENEVKEERVQNDEIDVNRVVRGISSQETSIKEGT